MSDIYKKLRLYSDETKDDDILKPFNGEEVKLCIEAADEIERLEIKLNKAIKALKIYDECMSALSYFVGHVNGRVSSAAHAEAVKICEKAVNAQQILDELYPPPLYIYENILKDET